MIHLCPRRRVLLLASAMPFAMASHALAQTTTAGSTPPAAAPSAALAEVVVTAERKTENLQKTPMSVTVISGEAIKAQGETNLEEIVRDVPGVTLTKNISGIVANIRGEGADVPSGFGQGAVAMEFDGIYDILYEAGLLGYFDVSRVEVLPGPQGTLYGVNADAGVINVITNDPVIGKNTGSASLTVGNLRHFSGQAAVNLPINSVLAMRIAGQAINQSSYYTPPNGGDEVNQAARVKLLYKPNDDLSVRLTYNFAHIGGMGQAAGSGGVYGYQGGSINNLKNPWGNALDTARGAAFANSHEIMYRNEISGDIQYNLDNFATLNVIPSWERAHDKQNNCGPSFGTSFSGPGSTGSGSCSLGWPYIPFYQFTGEARLNSLAGSPLQWDAGLYHWNYAQDSIYYPGAGLGIIGGHTNAVFGNATYSVMPNFRLIAGARMNYDRRWKNNNGGQIYTADFHHFDYRLGAEYDLTPSSMEYFTVATGYRPGGINTQTSDVLALYKAETLTSFEVGSKNRFLDNTLQVNADVYYEQQKNYQLFDQFTTAACQTQAEQRLPSCQPELLNLQGHVLGFEYDVRYNLTADDQVNFSGSLMSAMFSNKQGQCLNTSVTDPGSNFPYTTTCFVGANYPNGTPYYEKLPGEFEPHAPAFAANLSYEHTWMMPDAATLTGGVQLFYTTHYWVTPVEDAYSLQPSYWTQGMNVTYTPASALWSLTAYVHNLSNYAVKESVGTADALGEPRTFGVTAQMHW